MTKILDQFPGDVRVHAKGNPMWLSIAGCALAAANRGDLILQLFEEITHNMPIAQKRIALKLLLESLVKGGYLFGIPRLLNAYLPIARAVGNDPLLMEDGPILSARSKEMTNPLSEELVRRGTAYFRNIYREDTDLIVPLMDKVAPDITQMTLLLEYGPYLSDTSILNPVQTSQTSIASLLPLEVPLQVQWHMRGLIRNGGSIEDVSFALSTAKLICDLFGPALKNGLPDLDVVNQSRLA